MLSIILITRYNRKVKRVCTVGQTRCRLLYKRITNAFLAFVNEFLFKLHADGTVACHVLNFIQYCNNAAVRVFSSFVKVSLAKQLSLRVLALYNDLGSISSSLSQYVQASLSLPALASNKQ